MKPNGMYDQGIYKDDKGNIIIPRVEDGVAAHHLVPLIRELSKKVNKLHKSYHKLRLRLDHV